MKNKIKTPYVLALLFCFVFTFVLDIFHNTNPFNIKNVIFGISNVFIGCCAIYMFEKITSKNLKRSVSQLKKKLIPSFIFFVLTIIIIALIFTQLSLYLLFLWEGQSTSDFLSQIFDIRYTAAIISLMAGIFVVSIIFFYTTWRQAIDNEQKLREENLRYQYKTLKAQVNPHFLFNSLNTLSEIVYEDAKKADNYIRKLSGIYRYILDNEETDLIPLHKEIEFVNKYFELQEERDNNKIILYTYIDEQEKFSVVPISLQILVENALKHNSASENSPLRISIYREDLYIVVANNIQKKTTLDNSYGTGLTNLKERVKLITGRKVIVNQENNEFLVRIPIINS